MKSSSTHHHVKGDTGEPTEVLWGCPHVQKSEIQNQFHFANSGQIRQTEEQHGGFVLTATPEFLKQTYLRQ